MGDLNLGVFSTEDRAESTALTHALLLSATFFLLASVSAAGIGPVADAQGQLSMTVMQDRFEMWEDKVDTTIMTGDPERSELIVPPGTISIKPEATTINITNTSTGATKTIQTATFTFQATNGNGASSITYDSGLITDQLSTTTPSTVVRPPHQTRYTSGTDRLMLTLYEYNLSSEVNSQSGFPSQIRFNLYPNASKVVAEEYTGTDAEITVTGDNYDSWEAFFESSDQYQITSTGGNSVTATVDATYFNVRSRYIRQSSTQFEA